MNNGTVEIHFKDGKIISECETYGNYSRIMLALTNGSRSCAVDYVLFGNSIVAISEIEMIRWFDMN